MAKNKKDAAAKKGGLFSRQKDKPERSFMEEEQLQSPGRMMVQNFLHNKLGMTGLCIFLFFLLCVLIGPHFFVLDLSYQDNTQINVPPGYSLMKVPAAMEGHMRDISPDRKSVV